MKETPRRIIAVTSSSNEISTYPRQIGCLHGEAGWFVPSPAPTPFLQQTSGRILKDDVNGIYSTSDICYLGGVYSKGNYNTFSCIVKDCCQFKTHLCQGKVEYRRRRRRGELEKVINIFSLGMEARGLPYKDLGSRDYPPWLRLVLKIYKSFE